MCVCQGGLIDREKQKTVTFTGSLNKVLYSKLVAGFWLPFLSFSVSPEFLFPGLFILERWLCSVYRTHSLGGLYPRQTSWKKKGERGEEGCTLFGQTDNPNRIWRSTARGCVGLAQAQLAHKHTHARTHALVLHTQLWECSRWRAKSPFLLHIYSLLPFILPPFCCPGPPSFRPLALLHPSFLLW